jgi:hypothetical protein
MIKYLIANGGSFDGTVFTEPQAGYLRVHHEPETG